MALSTVTSTFSVDAGVGATTAYLDAASVRDVDRAFHLLEPDWTPLATLLSSGDFESKPAKSIKVEWLESEGLPTVTQTSTDDSGTATTTAITITTGTGAYLRINDLLRMETTGEIMRVDNIVGDVVTVTRGIGTAAVDWSTTNSLYIRKVGNASVQGATRPAIRMTKDVAAYNYTQIQRDPYGVTRTASQVNQYNGPVFEIERAKQMISHKLAIEDSLWFGHRDLKITPSFPQGFVGGVLSYIDSGNVTAVNGTLSVSGLEDIMEDAFRYNSTGEAWAFCSSKVFRAFSSGTGTGMGYLTRVAPSDYGKNKTYGIHVNEYVTSTGQTVHLVWNKRWNDTTTSLLGTGGLFAVLDMSQLAYRPLQTTITREGIQEPSQDGKENEILTEYSLQVTHGRRHALGTGITG